MGWGFEGMGSERNREGDICTLLCLKISFHILQIKRAAAHTPLQHFEKVCQKHMALQY